VGRRLRPFPDKDDCLVIDVVGVTDRLDLQTLPRPFGLRDETAVAETVTEAIDRQTPQDRAREQAPGAAAARRNREGAMRTRDVQLLGSRKRGGKLHWLRHGDYWLVSIGHGRLIALVPAGERWTVLRLDRDQAQRLAVDLDLGCAHGSAPSWPTPKPKPVKLGTTGSASRTWSGSDGGRHNPAAVRQSRACCGVPSGRLLLGQKQNRTWSTLLASSRRPCIDR
jgi:hypothetical protein